MMFLLVLMCWIGIAAGVDEDDDDEIESRTVSEGGNLTISVHIEKWDEDPQVLVTRLRGSSQEPIAQLLCHNGACEQECWRSGVSLTSDGQNITLILMNISYSQTGLYKVCKLSRQPGYKIYNLTVYQPPLSTISPDQPESAVFSQILTAGLSAAAVLTLLVIMCAVIGVIYRKRGRRCLSQHSLSDHGSYL